MDTNSTTNHQYISMQKLGLAASLVYAGCEIIGRACIEGVHYFVFEDTPEVQEIMMCYGAEKEKTVLPSELYDIIEELQREADDGTL